MIGLGLGLQIGGGGGAAGFNPSQFGSARIAHWKFSSGNVTLDGSQNVQSIVDLSSNGVTLSQGTAANRPAFTASGGGGGQGYATWSGNDQLVSANQTVAQPVEVFIIARTTTGAPGGNAYLYDFGVNINILFQQAGAASLQQYDGTLGATQGITANQDFLADAFYSGASSFIAVNGTASAPANCGTSGSSGTAITLGNAGGGGTTFIGRIYEVVILNRAATSSERTGMRSYSQATYLTP